MALVRNVRIYATDTFSDEAGVRFEQPLLGTDVQQLARILLNLKANIKYRTLKKLVDDALIVFNRSEFAKHKQLSAVATQPVPDWDYEIKL